MTNGSKVCVRLGQLLIHGFSTLPAATAKYYHNVVFLSKLYGTIRRFTYHQSHKEHNVIMRKGPRPLGPVGP